MGRILAFAYGVVAYIIFFVSFLCVIAFVGDLGVGRAMDAGPAGPLWQALLVNGGLLALFAVQHSVMARPAFKRWWTRIVPPVIERSTYVLLASLIVLLIVWQWRPMPQVVWDLRGTIGGGVLTAAFWSGWLLVLYATFLIDHFDLFGLRQVGLFLMQRDYTPVRFQTAGLYQWIRHPIMTGFLIAFWATPYMSVGHLVFALGTTGYILVGVGLEERDLLAHHGDRYRAYKRSVSMVLPLGGRWKEPGGNAEVR
jgi:protein-S-isoprenylcysteine O-methyltransferase Ste14